MAKAIRPHYVYLGRKIKKMYLSYAFCSTCNQYLPSRERIICPKCKEKIDWEDVPYLKSFN